MPKSSLDRLLRDLEATRTRFAPADSARMLTLLRALAHTACPDTGSLLRLHEALLFIRAFPHSPAVLRQSGQLLDRFVERVDALRSRGVDLAPLDPLEVSGIAGTTIEDVLSYDVVRWLARRFPRHVEIVWDGYDLERLMSNTWPRFLPLLEEDSYVEAGIPWLDWLRAARGRSLTDIEWFLRGFERLPLPDERKSELYDGLQMVVRWTLDNLKASRTRNWRHPRQVFYHRGPLLQRRDISLEREFAAPPLKLRKLSLREGRGLMDLIREVMAVRYRELYGTTLGDPRRVVSAAVGRGVEIFLWGLPPHRRLPLRAYLAGLTLKNGVPINYVEAISLFEWTEVGFNTFYTFRDGESAWIYAQALRLIRQLHNVQSISVYPYQIGQDNEEAIESGAFWFYRKLGFRPGRPHLLRLTEREEARIAAGPTYRTSARTLRRLAAQHIFYELPGAEVGAWDRFSIRNLGLALNRRMARAFGGDSRSIREASVAALARLLRVSPARLSALEQKAFEDFALILTLIPGLSRWRDHEKRALLPIIRAKVAPDELTYLRLQQRHPKLRRALLDLGSTS